MMSERELRAIAYLIGITIGAGILALPYAFAQVGFLIGAVELIIVWSIVLLLTLYLGEVVLRTKGNHEVTGLTEIYLGKKGKTMIVVVSILYIYGALVAYGLGLGQAAENLFGISPLKSAAVIFLFLAAIVYFSLEVVTRAEAFLTPFIFLIIAAIIVSGYGQIHLINLDSVQIKNIFLPFGPLFFALLGFWCVPDMKRILGSKHKKNLRKTIILGTLIIAGSYLLLIFVVLGITGIETTQLFSVGLSSHLGHGVSIFIHLFTLFAIVTSFLGLGFTLKAMFKLDYKMSNNKSWLCTFVVPFVLLFAVKVGFIDVITITGAIASVFVLATLVLMFHKAKKNGHREPEYMLNIPVWFNAILLIFCIIIALYTVWIYGARML